MKKPIIGLVAGLNVTEDRSFQTFTKHVNNYPKRIVQAGGIPVGLVLVDGKFNEEEADLCDGFIFEGGSSIKSGQVNMVHYALQKNKPILGICLGMQTMVGYDWILGNFKNHTPSYKDIENFFIDDYDLDFLEKKENHDNLNPFYDSKIGKSKHKVILDKDSILANIFGDNVEMPSVHTWCAKEKEFNFFKVVGRSEDGVVEAIESKNNNLWAVGVQFHPELEDKNLCLFQAFMEEVNKRRELPTSEADKIFTKK